MGDSELWLLNELFEQESIKTAVNEDSRTIQLQDKSLSIESVEDLLSDFSSDTYDLTIKNDFITVNLI